MKKFAIPFLIILFLASCESQENKDSRLTLDKYARKLNSMSLDLISSRDEEGSQSRLTLNRFYDRYTNKFESLNNDLDFEVISEKYKSSRIEITAVSRTHYAYLNTRKKAIINMSDAFSANKSSQDYEKDYQEYRSKWLTSKYDSYSSDFNYEMMNKYSNKKFEKQIEFITSSYSYVEQLDVIDSLTMVLDSLATTYNSKTIDLKLTEKLVIPDALNDTVNDWLITSKEYIEMLMEKDK